MQTRQYSQLHEAVLALDFERIDTLLNNGCTLNCLNEQDETFLEDVFTDMMFNERPDVCTVIAELLKRGADPNFRNSDKIGILTPAMWNLRTDVLRLLLEAGANPNEEGGFDESESFYDYAEFDYIHRVYDHHLPEEPTKTDILNPDKWLQFLDRLAIQYNHRRPDHLFLLRQFGAKRMREMVM